MSEEFKEENPKGKIIDGEHEGLGWGDFSKIFRPNPTFDWNALRKKQEEDRLNRERIFREAAEKAKRIRDEANRVNNLENQVKQLTARVQQLESIIKEKDKVIDKKNKHIDFLTKENTRLRKKVNALLDNLQYYRTLVLGNTDVDGYQTTVVKQQIKYDELLQQEIGKPVKTSKKEGFEPLYANYETLYSEFNNLQNEYNKIREGFYDPEIASYNSVFTENQAVKNQIENSTNIYSVNKQLSSNIIAKTDYLKKINLILICIFAIVYVYVCYKIYKIDGMNNGEKVAIGLVIISIIFIIHLVEYILVYSIPYISALLLGTPYNPPYLFSKPGIYDYLPTP
uniref:Uncharacterized protein n=1 Tax=viral metagenome TaxID=1070528 RepID=A0A6C0K1U7_9ZZZZ